MNPPICWSADALQRTVTLPGSKSISNRLLIMQALSDAPLLIHGLAGCDDTRILQDALQQSGEDVHTGAAGTAMRFLTAFFAATGRQKTLSGTPRMHQRPIGELTDALNTLGAGINCTQRQGYPPLRTSGRPMHGGRATLSGITSSQFSSALLMVAPVLPTGLTLDILPPVHSRPYIVMTLQLMQQAGIKYTQEIHSDGGISITVPEQLYQGGDFTVEPDWSAASYWYSAAALSDDVRLTLAGLRPDSLQGDAIVQQMFDALGVRTAFDARGAHLSRRPVRCTFFEACFSDCPDLVQTLAVTLCLLHIPFRFTGTESLYIKETDRTEALRTELLKLGFRLETDGGTICCNGRSVRTGTVPVCIDPHNDHRMALSFAPAALRVPLIMQQTGVISKSYPDFWQQALQMSPLGKK